MELHIRFKSEEEYKRTVDFIENESEFYGDANEEMINEELIKNDFKDFYFERA